MDKPNKEILSNGDLFSFAKVMAAGVMFIAMFAVMMTVGCIIYGYLFKVFWEWFILTTFNNLPALSLLQCVGILQFWHLIRYKIETGELKNPTGKQIFNLYVTWPIVYYIVGWIVHLFYK